MKVKNMTSAKGNKIANQFIITDEGENGVSRSKTFQSYETTIAVIDEHDTLGTVVYLDTNYWDYSATTGRYRNIFLGEGIVETRKKIESGEYELVNLN